ncbi:MAG: hypothetical protein OXC55_02775 [Chloroflexi bacterium]|nr:hypothetical protein [Chloroflexota bacterium]
MLSRVRVNTLPAWIAHLWAWGIGLFLALGPVYQGVSMSSTAPGERIETSSTLIEQNGLWVLWILLVPVLVSGVALVAIHFADAGHMRRRALLWTLALGFLGLCVITIISIGLLYLPMALALLFTAILNPSRQRPAR